MGVKFQIVFDKSSKQTEIKKKRWSNSFTYNFKEGPEEINLNVKQLACVDLNKPSSFLFCPHKDNLWTPPDHLTQLGTINFIKLVGTNVSKNGNQFIITLGEKIFLPSFYICLSGIDYFCNYSSIPLIKDIIKKKKCAREER
jgi:hypothetical protein